MPQVLIADKHSSEYLIHKYWSRKPANVVCALLQQYTGPGDLVLDPFCGSGVTLVEAVKLNRRAIGIDINPAAALLSRISTRSHDLSFIRQTWGSLIEAWRPLCLKAYASEPGKQVKHCVHAPVIECPNCERTARADQCPKHGNRYRCPHCNDNLNTSIAHATGTVVTAVQFASGGLVKDDQLVATQTEASARCYCGKSIWGHFDAPMLHNTRILAYPRMTTAMLFTPRNFSLIAKFAQLVQDAEVSEDVRDVLLLVLTSAVASCSRLIAYRDNMEGGGPAWTVPGFWVPPLHVERNPLFHLTARYQKVERGLVELSRKSTSPEARVYLDDSDRRLKKLRKAGTRVKYIFADPPYGDSVPFLEFCQIWNCWEQRVKPAFEREVVVSDRIDHKSCWEEYEQRLGNVLEQCSQILDDDGHLTVTFNNLEIRAWHALLWGLQQARFKCVDVVYQIPAVLSAKASFAPTSSYLGDVYATFTKASPDTKYCSWSVVAERLTKSAELRQGAVSRVTQLKVAALSILAENVDAQCMLELEAHFAGLPAKTPPIPARSPLYLAIVRAIEDAWKQRSAVSDAQLCAGVVGTLPAWFGLDQHEILDVARRLSGYPESSRSYLRR